MTVLKKIDKLLDEERKCLLKGDFQLLELIATKKVELSRALIEENFSSQKEILSKIRLKSNRNDKLLEASIRGIKSAITHVSEASEGSFMSYSKEGERNYLSKECDSLGKF